MDDSRPVPTGDAVTGFLAVTRVDGLGYCGGYLLLNSAARPVEFHCTLPVKPERAHEILYGAALEPWVFTELIARPLLEKSAQSPGLIVVEQAPLTAAGTFARAPLVRVWYEKPVAAEEASPAEIRPTTDSDPLTVSASPPVSELRWLAADPNENTIVEQRIGELSARYDLLEPFERIRQAIGEAHSSRAA